MFDPAELHAAIKLNSHCSGLMKPENEFPAVPNV